MTIDAGKLRHRVTIQGQSVGQDSNGNVTIKWLDVATVWASIEPLSAKEFTQSAAVQNRVVARVVIRYRADVLPSMRLVHSPLTGPQRLYNIEGVLADKDSGLEYLTLPVSTGVADGQ